MLRSPGFTLLGIVALGLGIGVNVAMFGTAYSVVLKPLPFPDPDTMRTVIRRGRDVIARDETEAASVTAINNASAAAFFGD